MIPAEAESFLGAHTRTFLVTVRPDGAPACHPMVGLWRDGALYMNTYRKSAKVRNVLREPRVACVVTTPDDDPGPRAVVIRGRAELIDAPEASPGRARAPVTDEVVDRVRARLAEGKRVVMRVVPDDVRLFGAHR